jgi:hypothetical protein
MFMQEKSAGFILYVTAKTAKIIPAALARISQPAIMQQSKSIFLAAVMGTAGWALWAQDYAMNAQGIPGGGGSSSGGPYRLTGSIGQATAGGNLTGGNYSIAGGFWSQVSVVQTPGAPWLTLSQSNGQLTISWPTPASNWVMQTNSNLSNSGGWTASGYAVSTHNGISTVVVPLQSGNLFFRLAQP